MHALLLALSLLAAPTLTTSPEHPVPGGVVVIDVRGVPAGAVVEGAAITDDLRFFAAGPGHQRALLGLRLSQKPGPITIQASVDQGGASIPLETTATVVSKQFRVRELKVASKFVSPPKSTQARRKADKKAIASAYNQEFRDADFEGRLQSPRPGAEVTAHFGDQRTYNGKKQSEHLGTDFDGDVGVPILSAAAGRVVLARDCYMSGNTVLVDHGGGLFTSYFHLSKFTAKRGDRVTAGEELGKVGKTGRVTGPHLHFGVKVNGRLVDAEEAMTLDLGRDVTPTAK